MAGLNQVSRPVRLKTITNVNEINRFGPKIAIRGQKAPSAESVGEIRARRGRETT
jgi:hypothetical protein